MACLFCWLWDCDDEACDRWKGKERVDESGRHHECLTNLMFSSDDGIC